MKRILFCALTTSLMSLTAGADVEPSPAAPFEGEWQIAFPDGEDVIVNVPDVSCDAPAIITATGETTISVVTPGGDTGEWDVKAFDGRFPWWQGDPNDPSFQSLVADWVREDAFLLAGKDRTGIRTDWARAKQWTRCPLDEAASDN